MSIRKKYHCNLWKYLALIQFLLSTTNIDQLPVESRRDQMPVESRRDHSLYAIKACVSHIDSVAFEWIRKYFKDVILNPTLSLSSKKVECFTKGSINMFAYSFVCSLTLIVRTLSNYS